MSALTEHAASLAVEAEIDERENDANDAAEDEEWEAFNEEDDA
jgi:hypothetical protein